MAFVLFLPCLSMGAPRGGGGQTMTQEQYEETLPEDMSQADKDRMYRNYLNASPAYAAVTIPGFPF